MSLTIPHQPLTAEVKNINNNQKTCLWMCMKNEGLAADVLVCSCPEKRLHREPEQEREWWRSSPWFTKIKQAAWEAQTVAAVKTSHCFDCFSFCLLSLRLCRRLKCTNGTNKSSTHKLAVLHFFFKSLYSHSSVIYLFLHQSCLKNKWSRLTAFAGKARSMTALKPLYREATPSSLISSRRTSRKPLGYFPSGAERKTLY